MHEEEEEEGERGPEPADLDEPGVEEVLLQREVRGRVGGRVRLEAGGVGRVAGARVEEREERAEEEGGRVDGEEDTFEPSREDGRAQRWCAAGSGA